ncbi:MAG: cytochrome c [Rubrivivax sp.]|nr:cytochrome c [Rubrivivax sp.]
MFKTTVTTACTLLAAALLVGGCSDSAKDTHPQQLLSQRKAVFKQFTGALEPLGLMARERKTWDAAAFKAGALELQRLSTLPWPYFTADGNYPPTRAKPAVWDKPAEFKQAQDNYVAALAGLLTAAERGGAEAGKPAVEQVEKACKACHDSFRNAAPGG